MSRSASEQKRHSSLPDEQRGAVLKVWDRLLDGSAPPHEALDYLTETLGLDDRGQVHKCLREVVADALVETQPNDYWDVSAPNACQFLVKGQYYHADEVLGNIRRRHQSWQSNEWHHWHDRAHQAIKRLRELLNEWNVPLVKTP